jgi:hypothetical protein
MQEDVAIHTLVDSPAPIQAQLIVAAILGGLSSMTRPRETKSSEIVTRLIGFRSKDFERMNWKLDVLPSHSTMQIHQ